MLHVLRPILLFDEGFYAEETVTIVAVILYSEPLALVFTLEGGRHWWFLLCFVVKPWAVQQLPLMR